MQADDWILYSMTHQAELARVRCGGWRRQYSHIVSSPSHFTFACYRNRQIHVDRRLASNGPALAGKHVQLHGLDQTCLAEVRSIVKQPPSMIYGQTSAKAQLPQRWSFVTGSRSLSKGKSVLQADQEQSSQCSPCTRCIMGVRSSA